MATSFNSIAPEEPAQRTAGAVRVFIVDDSNLIRSIYSRVITSEPGLELAGVAGTAEDAIAQIGSLNVQVILLDLEMPGMGGMRALPEILKRAGSAKVMVVSSLTSEGAEHTVKALSLGAADTLQKPGPGGFDDAYKQDLVKRIRALGRRPLRRDAAAVKQQPAIAVRHGALANNCKIVAIGASTGGIHATSLLLGALPPRIGVPILITQHLPSVFSDSYARQLQDMSGHSVEVAREGRVLEADGIYLAPGDAHLCVRGGVDGPEIRLDRKPVASGCMPSVDSMFASLARVYGARALGVVLTGMGRDGTEGAKSMVEAGSNVIVQNEASSVVWGMPGSVAKAGLASAILHPHDLAARVVLSVANA
ncbi:MAG: chemotaxis-specific protein-glutamate methyltransferase CheB [Novosphingobium sp.]